MADEITKVSHQLTRREELDDHLKSMEDALLTSSLEVAAATCDFGWIDPKDPDRIPPEWIEAFGQQAAERRHRVAKAAWLSNKEAPKAIDSATKIAIGIIRARSTENAAPKELHLNLVQMTQPAQYEEILVDE